MSSSGSPSRQLLSPLCEPITASTALLYGSLALSAGTAATTVIAQSRQASAQEQQQQQLVASNNTEAGIRLSQLRIQQSQAKESSAREGEKARQASQRGKATTVVAAGEAGIQGASVDALLQEHASNLGSFKEATLRQGQLNDSQYTDRADAILSGTNYENLSINAPVTGPNYLGGALQLAGSAMGAYREYNPSSFLKKK